MRLLHSDGYSQKVLVMMFESNPSTVSRHVNAKCSVHAKPEVGGRE